MGVSPSTAPQWGSSSAFCPPLPPPFRLSDWLCYPPTSGLLPNTPSLRKHFPVPLLPSTSAVVEAAVTSCPDPCRLLLHPPCPRPASLCALTDGFLLHVPPLLKPLQCLPTTLLVRPNPLGMGHKTLHDLAPACLPVLVLASTAGISDDAPFPERVPLFKASAPLPFPLPSMLFPWPWE